MEKKYKLLALDKEIASRKKSLNEELSKEYFDVYFINKLSDEIKQLVVDKETVTINTDKKIRYVLTPQQYIEYKAQQSKKKKFLLFNKH
jgi:Spy/CpxP family protein refolding chaperone